jgi:hypothetical protein
MSNKRCSTCHKTRLLKFYCYNKSKKDGLSNICKDCTKIYNHNDRERSDARINERRRKNRLLLAKLKEDTPCYDCGQYFQACVMDFDHVRGEKIKCVSRMLNYSQYNLRLEIAKCQIVCSNCHRIRTYNRKE